MKTTFIATIGIITSFACADIEITGTALALASHNGKEDRQTIDLSTPSNPAGSVSAAAFGANAQTNVTLTTSNASSSIHVEHTIDSGATPVGSGATDGIFIFTIPQGAEYEFSGLLETITSIPSIGPVVQIRTEPLGVLLYSATPNLSLPNRPVDFSSIPSTGTLAPGTYKLSWVHIANYIFSSSPAVGTGNFTLTLTTPGCNDADFNADGILNFFDISEFLAEFNAMGPSADLNGDGVLNFFDISSFLSSYVAGCP